MSKHIKDPKGRIVNAPAHVYITVGGERQIDPAKLKRGWSIATDADLAAQAAVNQAADASREKPDHDPALLDALATAIATKINALSAAQKDK